MSNLRKNVALATVSTLCGLIVVGIIGEVAVRKREVNRDSPPGTMPLLFYREGRLRHAMVRNYQYFGWVSINGHGFRGEPVSIDKPAGTIRVMAVGGSTTFDTQTTGDDRTWPARLEHWLQEALPNGPDVEVVNAGVPGYGVIDNSIRFLTELYLFCPDIVLLYHAHNDLLAAFQAGSGERNPLGSTTRAARPNEIQTTTPWTAWLERNSLLYTKVLARWRAMQNARRKTGLPDNLGRPEAEPANANAWTDRIVRGAGAFETNLRFFAALVRTRDAKLVIPEVTYVGHGGMIAGDPVRRVVANYFGFSSPIVVEGYEAFDAAARTVAEETGAHYIPTRDFGLATLEWYAEEDAIHFNDEGSERMARRLADALVTSHLVGAAHQPVECD